MATHQEQLDRLRKEKELKQRQIQLNATQIQNWRKALSMMGIPLANVIPEHVVIEFANEIQKRLDEEERIRSLGASIEANKL